MRVLIVNPGIYVYGGAELLITKLANYLTAKGIENALLTTAVLPEFKKDLQRTEIILSEKSPFFMSDLGEVLSLHRGIRQSLHDFDVINIHNFPAELSIFPFRKPVVWMCNEPAEIALNFKGEKSLAKRVLKKVILIFDKFVTKRYIKNVIVADDFNRDRFKQLYGLTPEVINYGIDYAFFAQRQTNDLVEKFGLSGKFVVLQVGMLNPYKNQIESIKTIEKIKDKIGHVKLILAGWGKGQYSELLKKYIQEKNLQEHIVITGHLSRIEIRDLYHAADVLLHPIKSQGGWLAPFEALCACLPVIVSEEMTAADILQRENIGVVTNDFAETILDVYKQMEEFRQIAIRGEQWVKHNLSWDTFCEKMLQMFYKARQDK